MQGFAYVEFLEADAVTAACLLEGSDLHSRPLKVSSPVMMSYLPLGHGIQVLEQNGSPLYIPVLATTIRKLPHFGAMLLLLPLFSEF